MLLKGSVSFTMIKKNLV